MKSPVFAKGIFIIICCFTSINAAPDPKLSIRLSEVAISITHSITTFNFVEIYTPVKNVSADGVTAVIYGAASMSILEVCPCDRTIINDLGFALCNCDNFGLSTQEYVGAIALHNADHSNFIIGGDAENASMINMIDSVLWQSYAYNGAVLPNPLQPFFAQGQQYHYPPPPDKTAYSINRCYGNSVTNGKWQAAFSWDITGTPNAPNICSPPSVIISELNFNKTYVELSTNPLELPLDNVTLAFVTVLNGEAMVSYSNLLQDQRSESSSYFTMGKFPSDVVILNWELPTPGPAAVVIYYNSNIIVNAAAPVTNILHSIVYGTTDGPTVDPLKPFGDTTHAYDPSGKCSLCVCGSDPFNNPDNIQAAAPTFDAPCDCSKSCPAL